MMGNALTLFFLLFAAAAPLAAGFLPSSVNWLARRPSTLSTSAIPGSSRFRLNRSPQSLACRQTESRLHMADVQHFQEDQVEKTFSRFLAGYTFAVDNNQQYDLARRLSSSNHNIEEYCANFSPNQHGKSSDPVVEDWLRMHGLWIPKKSPAVLTMMTFFIGHSSCVERYETVSKIYMIDYFINDFCGREMLTAEAENQQRGTLRAIDFACRMARDDIPHPHAQDLSEFSLELRNVISALLEVLGDLKSSSPRAWFDSFLVNFQDHFITSFDHATIQRVHTVADYVKHRRSMSGMEYCAGMFEYATGRFIDWERVQSSDREIYEKLVRLKDCGSDLGGLWNDLFSFEKETEGCTRPFYNSLLPMIGLNDPSASLDACINRACRMLSATFEQYMQLRDEIRAACKDAAVLSFVDQNDSGVYAGWVWQASCPRYKSPKSIWVQTDLRNAASSKISPFKTPGRALV